MFNITEYLKTFSKNISSSEDEKKEILKIIEKHTQIKLLLSEIEIKNYIAYIKKSPMVLNKIFINKNKILEDFVLLKINIIDIK